jgi:hypothetical protein
VKRPNQSETAILFFNHTEKQKVALQEIAPHISEKGVDTALGLLSKRVECVANKTPFPFFHVDADPSFSFEKQLFHAYDKLFKQGFSKVIAVANDCPTLNHRDILKANALLREHHFVFGPANDGGLYLLGFQKGAIDEGSFLALPWRSASLFEALCNFSQANQQGFFSLEEKADMDNPKSFYTAFLLPISFLKRIQQVLASFCLKTEATSLFTSDEKALLHCSLRAPPLSV